MTETNTTITQANDQIGTDNTILPKVPAAVEPIDPNSLKALIAAATANPATLRFPQDRWGFTSKIKTEVLRAASSVKGQDDKHDLLIATLTVLIKHVQLRKEGDRQLQAKMRQHRQAAADERGPRERVSGGVVNNQPVVIPAS